MFLLVGGCLATLNHTRLDVAMLRIPFTRVPLFGVRAHDTHHVIPTCNYGQYIMLFDWLYGTFRFHPQDDAFQKKDLLGEGGDRAPTMRANGTVAEPKAEDVPPPTPLQQEVAKVKAA